MSEQDDPLDEVNEPRPRLLLTHYKPDGIADVLWGLFSFQLHTHFRLEPPTEFWLGADASIFGFGLGLDVSIDRNYGLANVEAYARYPGGCVGLDWEVANWKGIWQLEDEEARDDA